MERITKAKSPGRTNLRGLLALNALLVLTLAAVTFRSFGSTANAQARGRGEYTMVAGGVGGSDSSAIYITDVANQELIVMTWNRQNKELDGVAYRNLALDAAPAGRGRTRPGN